MLHIWHCVNLPFVMWTYHIESVFFVVYWSVILIKYNLKRIKRILIGPTFYHIYREVGCFTLHGKISLYVTSRFYLCHMKKHHDIMGNSKIKDMVLMNTTMKFSKAYHCDTTMNKLFSILHMLPYLGKTFLKNKMKFF